MQKRKAWYVACLMVLGMVFWIKDLPAQVPVGSLDYCCTDLQGQSCAGWGSTVGCDYGYYGGGYPNFDGFPEEPQENRGLAEFFVTIPGAPPGRAARS